MLPQGAQYCRLKRSLRTSFRIIVIISLIAAGLPVKSFSLSTPSARESISADLQTGIHTHKVLKPYQYDAILISLTDLVENAEDAKERVRELLSNKSVNHAQFREIAREIFEFMFYLSKLYTRKEYDQDGTSDYPYPYVSKDSDHGIRLRSRYTKMDLEFDSYHDVGSAINELFNLLCDIGGKTTRAFLRICEETELNGFIQQAYDMPGYDHFRFVEDVESRSLFLEYLTSLLGSTERNRLKEILFQHASDPLIGYGKFSIQAFLRMLFQIEAEKYMPITIEEIDEALTLSQEDDLTIALLYELSTAVIRENTLKSRSNIVLADEPATVQIIEQLQALIEQSENPYVRRFALRVYKEIMNVRSNRRDEHFRAVMRAALYGVDDYVSRCWIVLIHIESVDTEDTMAPRMSLHNAIQELLIVLHRERHVIELKGASLNSFLKERVRVNIGIGKKLSPQAKKLIDMIIAVPEDDFLPIARPRGIEQKTTTANSL